MTVAAVIPAAGSGQRLGGGTPKALRTVGSDTLLVHAIRSLVATRDIGQVVVAAPAAEVAALSEELAAAFAGSSDTGDSCEVLVTAGGSTRQQSVANALAKVRPDAEIVLVHDAARPFAPADMVLRVIGAVRSGSAAVIPVVPIADTVRSFVGGEISDVVDRDGLRAVQTPQGFRTEVLVSAHAAAAQVATDDAGLVEAQGYQVTSVLGDEAAFKITKPLDLLLAQALWRQRCESAEQGGT